MEEKKGLRSKFYKMTLSLWKNNPKKSIRWDCVNDKVNNKRMQETVTLNIRMYRNITDRKNWVRIKNCSRYMEYFLLPFLMPYPAANNVNVSTFTVINNK